MAQEAAKQFLRDDSLNHLETSTGVVHLIHYPQNLSDYRAAILNLKSDRDSNIRKIEETQNSIDALKKIKWWKKILEFSKISEKREELIKYLGQLSKDIARLDRLIVDFEDSVQKLEKAINDFEKELKNLGTTPEEVLAEYERLKAKFVSGERHSKVQQQTEDVKRKAQEKMPAQNKKNYPKMSSIDKFKRRWGDAADDKNSAEKTENENQPE